MLRDGLRAGDPLSARFLLVQWSRDSDFGKAGGNGGMLLAESRAWLGYSRGMRSVNSQGQRTCRTSPDIPLL